MRRNGFTLVELIISLSIFALLTSSIFLFLGTSLRYWHKIVNQTETRQIHQVVLDKLCEDIRRASAILPSSHAKELHLQVGADKISYSLINKKVRHLKNAYTSYLTDVNEVTSLTFGYPQAKLVLIRIGKYETKVALRN
ncbi:MAG: prepilin-type N-terminal cleavage/methylation domain-containing protein [bacterium]